MKDIYQQFSRQLAGLSPQQRALFERKLAQKGLAAPAVGLQRPIEKRGADDRLELSFAQQRLWFIQQLDPANTAYNMMGVLTLRGALDIETLKNSIEAVVERHEPFRTSFELDADNQPVQIIHASPAVDYEFTDLSGARNQAGDGSDSDKTEMADQLVERLTQSPYDLRKPQFRVGLIKLEEHRHLLAIGTHHITSDRWSFTVFVKELSIVYGALRRRLPLAALRDLLPHNPVQYADWAIWQRHELQGEKLDRQLHYWRRKLGGEREILELPVDFPRRGAPSYRGARYPAGLPDDLSAKLRALAAARQVSLYTLLLAAFKALLHRYTGATDVIVGTEVANRDRGETQNMIGPLVNTLVLRSDLSGDPAFEDLLVQVNGTLQEGLANQDVPFEKLVEALNPTRDLSRMSPLFQVKFDLQHSVLKPFELDGLTVERYPLRDKSTKYELRFNLLDLQPAIGGQVEYASDLFAEETIARLVSHYHNLLAAAVENPALHIGALPLLAPPERRRLLEDWNRNPLPVPANEAGLCLHQLIERQARANPDAIAVCAAGSGEPGDSRRDHLSYRQLNERANQLAAWLRERGLRAGECVGVCLPASADALVAILAVVKAGGAYVPMDINYPPERLGHMIADAGIETLITLSSDDVGADSTGLTKCCPHIVCLDADPAPWAHYPATDLPAAAGPDSLLYVVYTSGSTGAPKGAGVTHRNELNLLSWYTRAYDIGAADRHLIISALGFDLTQKNLFAPLAAGGSIAFPDRAHYDPATIVEQIQRHEITLLNCAPSAFYPLLEQPHHQRLLASLRCVLLGGEPIRLDRLAGWLRQARCQLVNMYGPTECTDIAATYTLQPGDLDAPAAGLPIGRPSGNVSLYVLDEHYREPVPVGVPGSLYIGGEGVGTGYLNNPALSAEAFIDNPFGAGRLYRTGDLARWRADGNLEFIGRIDGQVKLRGYRIETGEIENLLRRQAGVKDAVVVLRDLGNVFNAGQGSPAPAGGRENNNPVLVAYLVPGQARALDKNSLRAALKKSLPDYMVPGVFVTLESIPLSANGKVNRRALPAPGRGDLCAQESVAPRTRTESLLLRIWFEQLRKQGLAAEDLGVSHNFFDIGGYSLLAIQIIAAAEAAFGVQIPLRDFFQAPTIADLAQSIDRQRAAGAAGAGGDQPRLQPATQADPKTAFEPFPLTDIQYAYWLGRSQAFELGNIGTHGYREFDLTGLPLAALETALNQLIERHPMLRAVVDADGRQRVLPEVPHYRLALTDLAGEPESTAAARLAALRERLSHQLFDPGRWPLFQVEAARLEADTHRIFVSFDVLIGDAWSLQIIGREIVRLIAGDTLPPLALTFRDYVLAERAFMQSDSYRRAFDYWQRRLDQLPPAPELPLTKAPGQIRAPRFTRRTATLPPARWAALKQRASRAGLTPSGLMLAAFSEVLARWSRRPQFTLNLTIFNRYPVHPDVNRIVGDFTASLLLAVDGGGRGSFLDRARRLQDRLWEDLDQRAVSGVRVLRELARRQNRATAALMPVVFTSTLNQESGDEAAPGARQARDWKMEPVYSASQTSQVYLDHQVGEVDSALLFNWDAIEELFPPGLLDAMFDTYKGFLQRLADDDSAWHGYPDLVGDSHLGALNRAEPPALPVNEDLLHELFFRQARQHPHHPAVISDACCLTYAELADRALALARALEAAAVQPNQLVAVSLPKGWQQVVACLGILTAGAAYVPIDPGLPQQRRHELIEDTCCEVVICDDGDLDWPASLTRLSVANLTVEPAAAAADFTPPAPRQGAGDLAYVIFTSGSTGSPKGVMIDHRGAVNTVKDINRRFGIGAEDRIFALSSLSFDLSVYDIFGPLAAGAAIVMPDDEQATNTARWRRLLTRYGVTVWNSVPALMQLLVTEVAGAPAPQPPSEPPAPSLRLVMMSGDWIALSLPDAIKRHFPGARVVSLGGATEASIWSIYHPIEAVDPDWRSIPYGRPLANQRWYVLDRNLDPCPPWVPGRLYIGGTGVARGYWNRPALSAEKFIADPFNPDPRCGATLYDTGDLGRYRGDGTLEFLGREDFQVKINGYRIELGEIEAIALQHPGVKEAIAHVFHTAPGSSEVDSPEIGCPEIDRGAGPSMANAAPELVVYIVPDPGDGEAVDARLTEYLREKLPQYMVPKHLLTLERIPLTANGKVDRRALPPPAPARPRAIVPARTPLEQQVLALWETLLERAPIGMDENFFTAGGNSLKVMQLMTQLQQCFDVELSIAQIFTALTPADQARLIEACREAQRSRRTIEAVERAPAGDLSDTEVDSMLAALLAEQAQENNV